MKEIGLWNPILEVDLGNSTYNFDKFSMDDMCALVEKWITWAHDNLYEESKVFINFRDLPDVMPNNPQRCLKLTHSWPHFLRESDLLESCLKNQEVNLYLKNVDKIHQKGYGLE